MRYLQAINWILLAACSVLATTLGVVCLLFWIYRAEPIMQHSFPELLEQTGIFVGMTLLTAAAAFSLQRRVTAYWVLQIAMFAGLAGTVNYYLPNT